MPAFEYAVGLGYRYVETDVQVTADGVLVAFHDNDLHRTCGVRGRISEMTWAEVQRARVRGEAQIPLLEELLGEWPELRVNIDCKTAAAIPALVSALHRTNALDRVMIGSFSDARLRTLRSLVGDELCTSLGPRSVATLRYGRPRRSPHHAAQIPVKQGPLTVTVPALIDRAHRLGLAVHVWTIDEPAEMHRLLDMGVDGIMTDKPGVLREVLESRGLWR